MSFRGSLRHMPWFMTAVTERVACVASLAPRLAIFLSTIVEHVKEQVLSANCDIEQPKNNARQWESGKKVLISLDKPGVFVKKRTKTTPLVHDIMPLLPLVVYVSV